MRGCRHSGVRLIVPPRRAAAPTRVTCRYLRKDKLAHPPPLMEGEALASRILELGPVGAKFLGPVMIEVPHFASLRGSEREIVILRSDNGEAWREHTVEASDEVVQEILSHSFDKEDQAPPVETDPSRMTRILTMDFPHYFAVVSRVKQEVHAIGPEGGMVSSSVVPQVQAVFPQGALTKKIKVGLQAQPIPTDVTAKLLGNRVAVSPIVTIEPRRRKFHKPITLTIPVPQAANKGMINQYSGDAPTLRLLCSITGGTARAQWEDVTGTTPLTFVKDTVSFTTTVSARFWLMDCRNVQDSAKMATELYREAIHVPFMAKFVVFAKRIEQLEARLRVFCMTDDREDKTLEHQEHFTEVAKSRDVEVLEGKSQFVEFAGNLVPVTKSGDQLRLGFRAFRENRLPFTVRVKDPHADPIGRALFMREAKVLKGEAPQQPICVLNLVLPDDIIPDTSLPESELTRYQYLTDSRGLETYQRSELRLSDISNLLENDWIPLASELKISNEDINQIQSDNPGSEAQQAMAVLRLWMRQSSTQPSAAALESALVNIGREDIIRQCIYSDSQPSEPSYEFILNRVPETTTTTTTTTTRTTTEFMEVPRPYSLNLKENLSDTELSDHADHEELKYKIKENVIDEPSIIEEPSKPVAEAKREIEKRLSQESQGTSIDKPDKRPEEPKVKPRIKEHVALSETVSKEEQELSFHEKRLSFEKGTSQDRVKRETDAFIQEEKKASARTSPPKVDEVEAKVDEAAKLSFKEKRKSFEQGSLDKPDNGDKKPKPDSKKSDDKIPEHQDEPSAKPEKNVMEKKVVSETISKTVETIGERTAIVSEKVTKTTEIKGDAKPVTTEVTTTTIHTPGEEKPVISKTTTKIVEETETFVVPGAKDKMDATTAKPVVVSETITSVTTDVKPSDKKPTVGVTVEKTTVSETITSVTKDSKPVDIKTTVDSAKPIVSETINSVIDTPVDVKSTLDTSKGKTIVTETITTVTTDSKPAPAVETKPTVDTKLKSTISETITSVTTDNPVDVIKTTVETNVKPTLSETITIVTSDGKPSDVFKTTVDIKDKPIVSETITTLTTDTKPDQIKTSVETVKSTVEKVVVPKDVVKEEIITKTVVSKDTEDEITKEKSPKSPDSIKDGVHTIETRVVSQTSTTKTVDEAPGETKTITETTKISSESGKPDHTTTITEVSVSKPGITLEERRKSEQLVEGVTQGLLSNVKLHEKKDILSPKLINTPPPSPADFKDAFATPRDFPKDETITSEVTSVTSQVSSPRDLKETSVTSPPTEPSWTSSTTTTEKTAFFIESERGPKQTDKPAKDPNNEPETKTSASEVNKTNESADRQSQKPDGVETTEEGAGGNEESADQKKSKKKRKRGKNKNKQNNGNNNNSQEKESEFYTEIDEINVSVDEPSVIVSENINIVEHVDEKKGKNKKNKKENKGITKELLNATNIARSMILINDPSRLKDTSDVSIEPIQNPSNDQSDVSDKNQVDDLPLPDNRMIVTAPVITEVIPKKTESISLDLSNKGLSNIDPERETHFLDDFIETAQNKIKIIDTKSQPNNTKNPFLETNVDPESFGDIKIPTTSFSPDIINFVTSDKKSREIPDKISGAVKVLSEINTSELPVGISGNVISEKISSEIPDIVHGNSRVTVEKVTTEIPNEISGISKIITETITTEIPDNISGVSKIVTEKLTTELNQLNDNLPDVSFFHGAEAQTSKDSEFSPHLDRVTSKLLDSHNNYRSAAEEEELTNFEETKDISNDAKFNDIINNLSSSSREDIEQLLAGTLSQDPGTQDEKLTNLLIDMLIEQETMKLAASGDLPADVESDGSDLEETMSTNQTSTNSDNTVIDMNTRNGNSFDTDNTHKSYENNGESGEKVKVFRTIVKDNSEPVFTKFTDLSEEVSSSDGNRSPKPYITTPTLSRRGIGGSQRYSREERPDLIEISRRFVSSSSDEEGTDEVVDMKYVVTEPSPPVNKRKVTFKFDSEDVMSDDDDNDDNASERVHFELVEETKNENKKTAQQAKLTKDDKRETAPPPKLSRSPSTDSTSKRNSIEIPNLEDMKVLQKVERKFERMASETLDDSSIAKGAVEGEFQRLTSQLSHEEMDECLLVWDESVLVPISESKTEDTDSVDELDAEGGGGGRAE